MGHRALRVVPRIVQVYAANIMLGDVYLRSNLARPRHALLNHLWACPANVADD